MNLTKSIARLGVLIVSGRALCSYLDPGSGSLIVQLIVAAIVGILATFRLWKSRLYKLFGINQDGQEESEDGA